MDPDDRARRFLVVEDEHFVARAFARCMRRFADTEVVGTLRDARIALGRGAWSGVVLDASLPDGSGIELLQQLRRERSALPVLVVTTTEDGTSANQCHQLDAVCVFKPEVTENLALFATRALARGSDRHARTAAALSSLRHAQRLSRRELQIAELVAAGVPRSRLAARVGVTENTMKTMVRSLLHKLAAGSVDQVARIVLEEVIRLSEAER